MDLKIDINKPAKFLVGKILDGGWVVKENITKQNDFGAMTFSESYMVENEGQKALLKALDFSIALIDQDPTGALITLSKSYEFEKELLELCESRRLNRIIKIIAKGNIPPLKGSIIPVPYFILEYAEKDIKSQIDFDTRLNTAWLLRILHNVTVGLWQLHKQGVAYKNLKSENIVEFSKQLQKITELGNSEKKGVKNPQSDFLVIDDPSYLTPEYLYGQINNEWIYKSQATDLYQLGSLIFFLFTQSNFNTWLFLGLDNLNPNYRPEKWGGSFEEVLPYLEFAYDWAIVQFFSAYVEIDNVTKDELEVILRQLCHPNPMKRGHPRNIGSTDSSFSVERFINQFDRLAKLAEIKLLTK